MIKLLAEDVVMRCNKKFILLTFSLISFFCGQAFSQELWPCEERLIKSISTHVDEEKIYLKQGVVHVSEKEMFVCDGDMLFPVKSIYSDCEGVYVLYEDLSPKASKDACPNGHTNLCWLCGGCLNFCRYRCVCANS